MCESKSRRPGSCANGVLLCIEDIAEMFRCSRRTVRRLTNSARVPQPVKLGRLTRWRRGEIEEWIAHGCPLCSAEGRRSAVERRLVVGRPDSKTGSACRRYFVLKGVRAMGNLDVMSVGGSEQEIKSLPQTQEVVAIIVTSEVQPVGPMGDQDLLLVFEIIRGPSRGQRILQRVHLWSHDERLRIKGRVALSTLCRALGVPQPADSTELHGKPVILRLTRKRGSEDKPRAQFLACSEADRQAWEEALAQAE